MGIFDNIKEGIDDFIFSLTTNDRYATSRTPYNANNLNSSSNQYRNDAANSDRPNRNNGGNNVNRTGGSDLEMRNYADGVSMEEIWQRFDQFLSDEYPELVEFLNEPATEADLNELENDIGVSLPFDVRDSYQIHDGQERGGKPCGVIFGLTLLDLESIAEEYSVWQTAARKIEYEKKIYNEKLAAYKQQQQQNISPTSSGNNSKLLHKRAQGHAQPPVARIDFTAHQRSFPPGAIQPVYVHEGWVPLVKDFSGNNIAVDLSPGPKGKWGQIICFGQDFDTKFVIADSWLDFLNNLVVKEFEKGNFMVDDVQDELWYALNGNKPLNFLDVLKNKFLPRMPPRRRMMVPPHQQHLMMQKREGKMPAAGNVQPSPLSNASVKASSTIDGATDNAATAMTKETLIAPEDGKPVSEKEVTEKLGELKFDKDDVIVDAEEEAVAHEEEGDESKGLTEIEI